jgi:hypothetical protein
MPLVVLHHLLNVFVQLANKRGFKTKINVLTVRCTAVDMFLAKIFGYGWYYDVNTLHATFEARVTKTSISAKY